MAGKHEQIAGGLIQDILSGRYLANDRLPSERDLASRYDANRGAVREAMKKLETLGFVEVQPGGARVLDRSEATLEAIGHMLEQGPLPDPLLVDQILVVINSLMAVAAEQAVASGSSEAIEQIRARAQALGEGIEDEETHTLARFELMRSIMEHSNNLPLQMIARSLMGQFVPQVARLARSTPPPSDAYMTFARQLDQALANKDTEALRASFAGLSKLNRESMMRSHEIASAELNQKALQQ